jgi:hypothetical protein
MRLTLIAQLQRGKMVAVEKGLPGKSRLDSLLRKQVKEGAPQLR